MGVIAENDVLRRMGTTPPFGMQSSGGPVHQPELIDPDHDWVFPDLTVPLTAALRAEGGTVTAAEDVNGALRSDRADGVRLCSTEGTRNGIVVQDQPYLIEDAVLELSGDGTSDFSCVGAALTAYQGSRVTVRNAVILTEGVIKPCTAATKGGVLHVYDSRLTARGGVLPAGYIPRPGPGMLAPPPALGIGGSCRAHLSLDRSSTYFYRTTIEANGWAALSTDGANGYVYLEANDCDLLVHGPGYGAYADGECHVVLNDCRVTTATHTAILAGHCDMTLRNVQAKSGRYCAMLHNVMGSDTELAQLIIRGGSIETGEDVFLLKSVNSYLDLVGVNLISRSGVLVRAVVNDDVCATKVGRLPVFGNNVVLTDMDVQGDILNEDSDRTMTLTLAGTRLTGRVQNAFVTLSAGSRWYAAGDSSVVLVGECRADWLDAPAGVTITAGLGAGCTLESGTLASGGTLTVLS